MPRKFPPPWYSILAYHQVRDQSDGYSLSVTSNHFRKQLAYLSDNCDIVPLADLLRRWQADIAPAKDTVALTFDDGYASVGDTAWPVLQEFRAPATVFLATGFLDDPSAHPWWDRLKYAVMQYSGSVEWDGHSYPLHGSREKKVFFRKTSRSIVHDYGKLARLPALLESMQAELPAENDFLRWDTVRTLKVQGLLDFAPHTVTHPVLSRCSNMAEELRQSTQRLRVELGQDSDIFAYPYGRPQHFTEEVKHRLGELGYEYSLTTVFGHLKPGLDPLSLPRINIGGKDKLKRFRAKLLFPPLFETAFKWREIRHRFGWV